MPTSAPLFARQPIFDNDLQVVAHELLFRGEATSGEAATAEVLMSAFDASTFEHGNDGLPVFVNFPEQILLQMPLLDKSKLVIEVLENVLVTPELVNAIKSLHNQGYRIALDDYEHNPEFEPLLEFADIIKLDVLATPGKALDELAISLRQPGRQLLAEKVETHEVYDQCRGLGMDFYQGFFFAKPNIVHGASVSVDASTVLSLLAALQDPELTTARLENIILSDAVLTVRILKLVNSASFRRANEITSVANAIAMLGMRQISAFASLFSLQALENKPVELSLYTAFRADYCQRLGRLHDLPYAPESLLALGVLSCTEAYFDQPIAQLAQGLPITEEYKLALTERDGLLGAVLTIAQHYQEGTWQALDWRYLTTLGLDVTHADDAFRQSDTWLTEHQSTLKR